MEEYTDFKHFKQLISLTKYYNIIKDIIRKTSILNKEEKRLS